MKHQRPIIQEAIVFARFQAEVDVSIYSEYFRSIQDNYPSFIPVPQQTMVFGFGPEGPLPTQHTVQHLTRYTHTSGNLMLTLAVDSLTLHVLPPYPGWEKVMEHANFAWGKLIDSTRMSKINLMSVRYINTMPLENPGQVLGDWLKPNNFLPVALLESSPVHPCRIQKNFNSGQDASSVTVSTTNGSIDGQEKFIFDIERTKSLSIEPDLNIIKNSFNELHDSISGENGIFDTSLTKKLQEWMNPDQ
jgi:uncharacterized protein (TIGR04255 family)